MVLEKICPVCGITFQPRDGEAPSRFKFRTMCSKVCALAFTASKKSRVELPPKICTVCGGEFSRRDGEELRGFKLRETCSPECRYKVVSQKHTKYESSKLCEVCGVEFFKAPDQKPSEFQRKKTCSKTCEDVLHRKSTEGMSKICPVCGVEFFPREGEYPSFFKERQTCSKECGYKIIAPRPKIETGVKICVVCGEEFIKKENEHPGHFLARETCGRVCANKLIWQQPEIREKMLASMNAQRQQPEYREKISAAAKESWENNDERKKAMSDRIKQNWTSNEYRDKVAQGTKDTMMERYGVPYFVLHKDCKFKSSLYSAPNKKFAGILDKNGIEYEPEFVLENRLFDIKVGNILIEINPFPFHNVTWHPFNPVDKNYHLEKTKLALENGYRCIHVWDWDDWDKIISLLLPRQTLYARNLELKEVSLEESTEFLNNYHLQNSPRYQPIRLGLYSGEELISIVIFGKPRYNKNYEYELLRLCTKPGYKVVGGANRLFKHFLETHNPSSVISYCDMSKFTGEVYKNLGMRLLRESAPAKHWYNPKTKQHFTDSHVRKHGFDRLVGESLGVVYGKGTSNDELFREYGFVEIFDSGQGSYVFNRL